MGVERGGMRRGGVVLLFGKLFFVWSARPETFESSAEATVPIFAARGDCLRPSIQALTPWDFPDVR